MFPDSRMKAGNVECFKKRQCRILRHGNSSGHIQIPKAIFVIYLHRIQANYWYEWIKNNCTRSPFYFISLAGWNLKCVARGRGWIAYSPTKEEATVAKFLDSIHVGRPGVAFESKPLRDDHSSSPPRVSNRKTIPPLIEAVESPRMATIITSSHLQQPSFNAERGEAREESSIVKQRERSLKWRLRCAIPPHHPQTPSATKTLPQSFTNKLQHAHWKMCKLTRLQSGVRVRMTGFEKNCSVIGTFHGQMLLQYQLWRESFEGLGFKHGSERLQFRV